MLLPLESTGWIAGVKRCGCKSLCGAGKERASPWRTGEAAAEQHGAYEKQLPQLKPGHLTTEATARPLGHCRMPYAMGHMLKTMPRSSCVCALVLLKSKGIKHVSKVQHVLQHSCVWEAHGHRPAVLQGAAFLSLNSFETAAIDSKAHNTCCCILAVFGREHIPSECAFGFALLSSNCPKAPKFSKSYMGIYPAKSHYNQ